MPRNPAWRRQFIRLLAGLALAWACGGDSLTTPPPQPELPRPTTVTVSPASAELSALGETVQLTVEVRDQNARVMAGTALTWSSSDRSVATTSGSGLVTGVAEGSTTITASAGSGRGTSEITVIDPDRAALVALYEATGGTDWRNKRNWLTGAPLGEWYGVRTDRSGRVVSLDLSGHWDRDARQNVSHGLSGAIPAELGNLGNLERLHLPWNELSGAIPAELGKLVNLKRLDLGVNELSGAVPAELATSRNLEELYLSRNELSGAIPAELGKLANLERLDLSWNKLSGTIPAELGSLANLEWLDLSSNNLSGPVPDELGNLAHLQQLDIPRNELSGAIPGSFLALDALERFRFERNADLCAPGTIDFVTWLEGIEDSSSALYCNESDTHVLNQLYETAGGPGWTHSGGWFETPALEGWYGITANSLGRVTALDLSRNRLGGRLPASLGKLAQMTELRIAGNSHLSGRLPLLLARLPLRTLQYAGTGLCAPSFPSFRDWLGAIPSHEGTDAECAAPSDREVLEALYDATGGPDWTYNENWLTDAPLGEWHGVRTDGSGLVVSLDLFNNDLAGPIPPEVGDLAALERLDLHGNELSGAIPTELGRITSLGWLRLSGKRFERPDPARVRGTCQPEVSLALL